MERAGLIASHRDEQTVDVSNLESALHKAISGEVRFDSGTRAIYAVDSSNYRQVPIAVVIPKSIDDVVNTVAICRYHGAPVLSRGAGTSLCGQTCNVAVVIDFSKYLNHIISLNAVEQRALVQPGVVLDDLRDTTEEHHLTFAPDPSTHTHNTLGGMIGNNSCGTHSMMGGNTIDNIESLEILTYDGMRMRVGPTSEDELQRIIDEGGRRGEIYQRLRKLRDQYADEIRTRFPKIPRRVSGYNLDQLLPENGSMWPGHWWAPKVPALLFSKPNVAWYQAPLPDLCWYLAIPMCTAPAITSRTFSNTNPSAWKALMIVSLTT